MKFDLTKTEKLIKQLAELDIAITSIRLNKDKGLFHRQAAKKGIKFAIDSLNNLIEINKSMEAVKCPLP